MNNKFDELTKGLAQSVTRRAALKKFGSSARRHAARLPWAESSTIDLTLNPTFRLMSSDCKV